MLSYVITMSDKNLAQTFLETLIRFPSVTPEDAGCQAWIASRLQSMGFTIEHLPFGKVSNLWAKRGNASPLFVFAGHTDVVPAGPLGDWKTPPFEPTVVQDILYGRGAADMKGSIAAMLAACAQFIAAYPDHAGAIAFLLTSDEEGPAIDGTRKVVEYLKNKGEVVDWCLVGEPSSEKKVGDTLKIGRRGSLNCSMTIAGKQGHIAYPHLSENPIHRALAALSALVDRMWDAGYPSFPSTAFQISNIHAGTGVTNVIPGSLEVTCNFRYSPAVTVEALQTQVQEILSQHDLRYTLDWSHSGAPFLTPPGKLLAATQSAIEKVQGITPLLSTDGGTSDGRFIVSLGCEVLECGPCNASIHQVDEHIALQDLAQLTEIYTHIMIRLLVK